MKRQSKQLDTLYVAYGSNLDTVQMAYRCKGARKVGKAMLKGFRLSFNGVATIIRDRDGSVPVGLWLINNIHEKELDIYEGYPHLYRKEMVAVEYKGEEYEALVYIMNEGRRALTPPSVSYFSTIRRGYRHFGMDDAPLREALLDSYFEQDINATCRRWFDDTRFSFKSGHKAASGQASFDFSEKGADGEEWIYF